MARHDFERSPVPTSAGSIDGVGITLGIDAVTASTVAFGPGTNYRAGPTPVSVTTATLNGHADIVVGDVYGGVSVLLGDGSGSFGRATSYAAGSGVSSVVAADLYGSGKQDLVVAAYNSGVSVLLGDGHGGFGAPVTYAAGTQPVAVVTAQLDGRNGPDIVVANFKSGDVSVLLRNGRGYAHAVDYAAGVGPDAVTTADLRGDGRLDLIVADFNGGVAVLAGDGQGRFGTAVHYAAGPEPTSVTAADLNGDHRSDLIVTDRLGGVSVLLNDGHGGFDAPITYDAGSTPVSVTTADLTGNGLLDIIVADFAGGEVSVLLNDGHGGFAAAVGFAAGPSPESVTTADVNGDGKPDIIVADEGGGVTVLLNKSIELCFMRGTRILTPYGERRIEDLQIGHHVVTRFGGVQAIGWIGRQSFDPRFLRNNPARMPVRIKAGALGDDRPSRDLFVSNGHSMLIGGTLVLARNLINGITITRECPPDIDVIEYYQLDLHAHDCVMADGSWSETFADGPGLRDAFHNVGEYRWMFPGRPDAAELRLCAPRPERGPALETVLRPVAARAAAMVAPGTLDGFVDIASPARIEGWAHGHAYPDLPVLLEVCLGGAVIGTVLACDHRGDLARAGKGGGYCAFGFTPATPLDPAMLATLTVRRAADGAALTHTAECRRAAA